MGIASFYRKTATAAASAKLDGKALDQLFREARTHNGWRPIDVPDSLLEEAVELAMRARPQPIRRRCASSSFAVLKRKRVSRVRWRLVTSTRPWPRR